MHPSHSPLAFRQRRPDTLLEEARLENTALLCRGLQVFGTESPPEAKTRPHPRSLLPNPSNGNMLDLF